MNLLIPSAPSSPPNRLPGAKVQRITQHIQQNVEKRLTLRELATVVNMSPYHFARLFREATGVPPHRFVVRQRIERAIELLMDGRLAVGRIGQLVGFRSSSHFGVAFRRTTGASPTVFRARKLADAPRAEQGG